MAHTLKRPLKFSASLNVRDSDQEPSGLQDSRTISCPSAFTVHGELGKLSFVLFEEATRVQRLPVARLLPPNSHNDS